MYRKKNPISGLKGNERIEDIFVVKIKKGIFPYVNGYYFHLLLSDAEGKNIDYKYWGEKDEAKVRALYESIEPDAVVLVQGRTAIYMGTLQIATNHPDTIKVLGEGEYDPSDFVKKSKRDIGEMVQELRGLIASVQNPEIKRLLERIFIEDEAFMDKFKQHPAAIQIHHNWAGGLIEHSLQLARYCEASKAVFPELDRDLMIAGALLHDIGKLSEIQVTTRIKGTKEGQLIGHIPIGYSTLSDIMEETKISDELRMKLLHIVLSHQGQMEYGSPKEPMFPEAVAVYLADELSSKLAEIIEFVGESKKGTEDDFMYHNRHRRNIYLK
ncbi:MAG: HD domain-containing protein [Candidatus Aenigmarchaeota archaeon]|nr:HD domain-containing protein [Candidatus Aenigmarchaeota archaeon]